MSEWISVEERLPLIPRHHLHAERPALVACDGEVRVAFLCMGKPTGRGQWDVSEEFWEIKNWFCAEARGAFEPLGNVTHWQPLPQPPQ